MLQFDCRIFASTAALVKGHLEYINQVILVPFMKRMQPIIVALRTEVNDLVYSFLEREPVSPAHWVTQDNFYAESSKRDVAASLRRFSLGVQTRGL